MTKFSRQGFSLGPGGGDRLSYGGQQLLYKVRGEQTQGRLGVVEFQMPPRLEGPPLHTDGHDELFIVAAGEMTFQLDEEVLEAPAGSLVFVPEGVRHTFANRQDAPARLLTLFSPGGFERLFEQVVEMSGDGPPDMAKVLALGASYGTNYVGQPKWRL